MGPDRDAFCRAAAELGLVDAAVADRIAAQATSAADARDALIVTGQLAAADVERIDQLVRARAAAAPRSQPRSEPRAPRRPSTPRAVPTPAADAADRDNGAAAPVRGRSTARGRAQRSGGGAAAIFGGLGLLAVAGVAGYIIATSEATPKGDNPRPARLDAKAAGPEAHEKPVAPAPDPASTDASPPADDSSDPTPAPDPTAPDPAADTPTPADPTPADPPGEEKPDPGRALRDNEEFGDDSEPAGPPPVPKASQDSDEIDPDDPRARGDRDPKLLAKGDAEYERGEAANNRVGSLSGDEREEVMVEALRHYTEALAAYRKYAGHRYPAFLEKRVQEVNSRVALLRKLLPPERVAEFSRKLTGPKQTATELLAEARRVAKAAPRDLTTQFMYFQRVLDEWPASPEALVALAAIGRLGWRELEETGMRRGFRDVADEWAAWMRAGDFGKVEDAIQKLGADETLRRVLRSDDWARVDVFERALRVPKACAKKLEMGQRASIKRRGGGVAKGTVDRITSAGVTIDGRPIAWGAFDPEALVALAFGKRRTATYELTTACFLAVCAVEKPALAALERARKRGAAVSEVGAIIERFARTKEKPRR